MQRYNFDRIRDGVLMAEGIAVHANTADEAAAKAQSLLGEEPGAVLLFRDNRPCPAAFIKCPLCAPEERKP
jgi:hypothetical protein